MFPMTVLRARCAVQHGPSIGANYSEFASIEVKNWDTVNKTKHNQVFAGIWDDPFAEQQNINRLWDRQIVRYYILIKRHSNLLGSCITCIQHKYMIDESYSIIASNCHNYLPCRLQLPAWGNICKLVWPI